MPLKSRRPLKIPSSAHKQRAYKLISLLNAKRNSKL